MSKPITPRGPRPSPAHELDRLSTALRDGDAAEAIKALEAAESALRAWASESTAPNAWSALFHERGAFTQLETVTLEAVGDVRGPWLVVGPEGREEHWPTEPEQRTRLRQTAREAREAVEQVSLIVGGSDQGEQELKALGSGLHRLEVLGPSRWAVDGHEVDLARAPRQQAIMQQLFEAQNNGRPACLGNNRDSARDSAKRFKGYLDKKCGVPKDVTASLLVCERNGYYRLNAVVHPVAPSVAPLAISPGTTKA